MENLDASYFVYRCLMVWSFCLSHVLDHIFMVQWLLEKKVVIFCNVNFSLILSNRITIFGMCVPCKVFTAYRTVFTWPLPHFMDQWTRLSFGGQVHISDTITIGLVYSVYGIIVRCTYSTGRCHLTLTSFSWFWSVFLVLYLVYGMIVSWHVFLVWFIWPWPHFLGSC